MILKDTKICIVCFANYCRSPVAERILAARFPKKIISSAGLNPIGRAGMDLRSRAFLDENNYPMILHTPKKISKKILDNNDLILAMDELILFELNKLFPKYTNKIKLITFKVPKIKLIDPFNADQMDYLDIMNKIETVCKNMPLEDE